MKDLQSWTNQKTKVAANKMNKQLHIQFSFSCLAIGVFTYLFFKYPFSLGGSVMLGWLIAAFIPLTLRIRKLSTEFSIIQLITATIMGINFLSYWEISGKTINIGYLFIFYGFLFLMITRYLLIVDLIFKNIVQLNETDQYLIKQIRRTLVSSVLFIGMIFSLCSGLMVHFIRKVEPVTYYNNPNLRLSYVAIAMLIFFFLIAFIYLTKIKDEDIKGLLSKAEEKYNLKNYDAKKIKNYSLLTFVLIIILGSFIEIQRGMWVMWIETILLLALMSLIIWKIYKHFFFFEEKFSQESIKRG